MRGPLRRRDLGRFASVTVVSDASPELLPRALAEAIDRGATVLAPGGEIAARVFATAEQAQRARGLAVWPTPRVYDANTWLRQRHVRRQLVDPSLPRCLEDTEERELWREVIAATEVDAETVDTAALVGAVRRARRTLYDHQIPGAALGRYDTAETRALGAWLRAFEARLRELRLTTLEHLWQDAALAPEEPVVWLASPEWRPQASRWLAASAALRIEPVSVRATARRLSAACDAAELAAAAEWARAGAAARPGARLWLCIPDLAARRDAVRDAFDAALAPRRLQLGAGDVEPPYAIAGGTPLAAYAPVRCALALLAASHEAVPFEEFSGLLREPGLVEGARPGADAARLDLLLRRYGPAEAPLAQWLALGARLARDDGGGPPEPLLRLAAAHEVLAATQGRRPLSAWVRTWIEAWHAGPWRGRAHWSSVEYQAAERLRALLDGLAAGDPVYGARSRRAAEGILRRAAGETAFQPSTGVPPIWITGRRHDPWLAQDGLWVMNCDAEHWPPPPDPAPLLPLALQREYGVDDADPARRCASARILQEAWMARAAEVVWSAAATGDGHAATPSALLPDASPFEASAPPRPHWLRQRAAAPALESIADGRAPPFAAPEVTRGVATLRAQSSCPFRGFAETRLRAEPLVRPLPGFDELERGRMLHEALEVVWGTLGNSAALERLDPQAQARLLDAAAERALARAVQRRDPGEPWRRRERARLPQLLARWLEVERARAPFTVEALEAPSAGVRLGPLELGVRIDRADRLLDGGRLLIDYKTGNPNADWRGERPANPQLPLYALLQPEGLVGVAYGVINAAGCRFVAECERAGVFAPGSRRTKLEEKADFAALVADWRRRLEVLASEFAQGDARLAPAPAACANCALPGLCRVGDALRDEPVEETAPA